MQTKCPNCETIFRLTDEQLSAANGKVRCGLCLHIFNASSVDEEPTSNLDDSIHDEPYLEESIYDETYADDDYYVSEIANLSDEVDADESQEVLFEDTDSHVIPDEYRIHGEQEAHTPVSTGLWSLGIVFLLMTLVSEYAWFNRNQLVKNTKVEPWISQFCEMTGCTIDPIHKPELIEMVNRNVYTHPNIKKALMISATMVNTASHAQAYPDVEITFSNVRGNIVTRRVFTPEEYMKMDEEHLRLLKPDTPISFGLEIKDPGKQAMTYEFNFL